MTGKERVYDSFRKVPVRYLDYLIAACAVGISGLRCAGYAERQRNYLKKCSLSFLFGRLHLFFAFCIQS